MMKALVIYEEVAAATRAITILRRASALAKTGARWQIKPWRAGVLKLPIAADEALLEAIDADVILLAELPASGQIQVMDWLQCWSALRQTGESARVVTYGANCEGNFEAVSHELTTFAAQNKLGLMIEANPA